MMMHNEGLLDQNPHADRDLQSPTIAPRRLEECLAPGRCADGWTDSPYLATTTTTARPSKLMRSAAWSRSRQTWKLLEACCMSASAVLSAYALLDLP